MQRERGRKVDRKRKIVGYGGKEERSHMTRLIGRKEKGKTYVEKARFALVFLIISYIFLFFYILLNLRSQVYR